MMKALLLIYLVTSLSISLRAQVNKLTVGIEYSPNFSGFTTPFSFGEQGFLLSHNAFLKAGNEIKKNLQLTLGAGFLNTRKFDHLGLINNKDLDSIHLYHYHNYIVFPLGLQYNFGSFYLNPEIGFGLNAGHPIKQINYFTNGSITEIHGNISDNLYNRFTFPVFFSFGNEFEVGSFKIILGAKAYYSLSKLSTRQNTRPEHYYGFGVVTGVKF